MIFSKFNYYNKKHNNFKYRRNRYNSDGEKNKVSYKEPMPAKEIEIDLDKLKYSLTIKYKYTFEELKEIIEKLKKGDDFKESPKFLFSNPDILRPDPKELVSLEELIKSSVRLGSDKISSDDKVTEDFNTKTKIPKVNPLANFGKGNINRNLPGMKTPLKPI